MLNPLAFFKSGRIDAFSRELASDFARRYPLELERGLESKRDRKRDKKLGRALNHVYKKAGDYAREQRLGVYGTARLGNAFKWALKDMGYRQEFIDETTKGLILNARGK